MLDILVAGRDDAPVAGRTVNRDSAGLHRGPGTDRQQKTQPSVYPAAPTGSCQVSGSHSNTRPLIRKSKPYTAKLLQ